MINSQYQQSLLHLKSLLQQKLKQVDKQLEQVRKAIDEHEDNEKQEIVEKKCSAYIGLEILYDKKARKIFQISIKYNTEEKSTKSQEIDLKHLSISDLRNERQIQRIRQTKNGLIDAKASVKCKMNTREAVLRKVISIIPKEQINWQAWAKGATKLLNMHTSDYSIDALELFKFYNEQQEKQPTNWTEEDDQKIKELVKEYGEQQWGFLGKVFKQKSSIEIRERWFKKLKNIKKQRWHLLEDLKLMILVDYFGEGQWNKLGLYFNDRTEVQIRERWCNVLNPRLSVRPWQDDEIDRLRQLIQMHGKRWNLIGLLLKRTDNECRRKAQKLE